MDAAARPDASARAFGLVVSAMALLAGWLLATPLGDRLSPDRDFLGPVSFALLLGASLALAGHGARLPPLAWAGAGISMLLYVFARMAWPYLPLPMLLVAAAAWLQALQPRKPPAPVWGWLPAPAPPPR